MACLQGSSIEPLGRVPWMIRSNRISVIQIQISVVAYYRNPKPIADILLIISFSESGPGDFYDTHCCLGEKMPVLQTLFQSHFFKHTDIHPLNLMFRWLIAYLAFLEFRRDLKPPDLLFAASRLQRPKTGAGVMLQKGDLRVSLKKLWKICTISALIFFSMTCLHSQIKFNDFSESRVKFNDFSRCVWTLSITWVRNLIPEIYVEWT